MTTMNQEKKPLGAMDILFLELAETFVGGSAKRRTLRCISRKNESLGIDEEELWWYLDTRRFGSLFIQVSD